MTIFRNSFPSFKSTSTSKHLLYTTTTTTATTASSSDSSTAIDIPRYEARGIPNVSGRDCFMSTICQMLWCLDPIRKRMYSLFKFSNWKEVLDYDEILSPEEKDLLRIFSFLCGRSNDMISYLGLYNIGWKSQSIIEMQDAGEFLVNLIEFLLNAKKSLLAPAFPTYREKNETHFLYLHASRTRPFLEQVLPDCRLLALEPKYPGDPEYKLDVERVKLQRYIFIELNRGSEESADTEEVKRPENNIVAFIGEKYFIRSIGVRVGNHYICCCYDKGTGGLTLYNDECKTVFEQSSNEVDKYIDRNSRLYLLEKL